MATTVFFDKKKPTKNKKNTEQPQIVFNDSEIDIIDKKFKTKTIEPLELGSELSFENNRETSLEKLGISSIQKEPITTVINREKTKLQVFITLNDYVTSQQVPVKTDIPCFHCRRKFNSVPIGIPIDFHPSIYTDKEDATKIKNLTLNEEGMLQGDQKNRVKHLDYFDVDGIFCSFNCVISFVDINPSPLYRKTNSLIPQMYKMIFGTYPSEKILKAPCWRLRREYGGPLTDEEFVKNLQILQFTDSQQVSRISRILNPVGKIYRVEEVERK